MWKYATCQWIDSKSLTEWLNSVVIQSYWCYVSPSHPVSLFLSLPIVDYYNETDNLVHKLDQLIKCIKFTPGYSHDSENYVINKEMRMSFQNCNQ